MEQESQLQPYQQMQNAVAVTSGDTQQQRRATIQNLKNQNFGTAASGKNGDNK